MALILERKIGQRLLVGDDVVIEALSCELGRRRAYVGVDLGRGGRPEVVELEEMVSREVLPGVRLTLRRVRRRRDGALAMEVDFDAPRDVPIVCEEKLLGKGASL